MSQKQNIHWNVDKTHTWPCSINSDLNFDWLSMKLAGKHENNEFSNEFKVFL